MAFSFTPEALKEHAGGKDSSLSAAIEKESSSIMARMGSDGKSFIDFIAKVILGIAASIALGMLGYYFYIQSSVESKKTKILEYETKLGAFPLEEMRHFSNRLKFVNQLIKEHPSVNAAFRLLEESVEDRITYSSFEFGYDEGAKVPTIAVDGVAPDYKTLAQQMDALKAKPYTTYISNVELQNLEPNDKGLISFRLSMSVAVKGVLPEELILANAAPVDTTASSTSQEMSPIVPTPTQNFTGTTSSVTPGTMTPPPTRNPNVP